MARLSPGVKLLRSLARTAKAQRKMMTTLLGAATIAPPKLPKLPKLPKPRKPSRPPEPPHKPRPSAAAAPLPAPTGDWLMGRHLPTALAGPGMDYWLYLPRTQPDAAAQRGWPLVVMLHGCQQSATQFADGTRMNRLADSKGYAVLYPQQSIGAHAQGCWRWYDRATQQGGGDTALLADLVTAVCVKHRIDRRRIYACGLSAGAGMAAVLALNHPELIAAVGLHSAPVFGAGHSTVGALRVMRHGAPLAGDTAIDEVLARRRAQVVPGGPGGPMPMPPMPAILIQGADDQVVHPVNQQHLARQWLQLNNLGAAPARITVKPAGRGGSRNAHEIHDYLVGRKPLLRVARIAGLGHAWSGGDAALRFNMKAGPDASRMMLEFFGRHQRLMTPVR